MRGESLQPFLIVLVQAGFVVVNKDGGGDMHRIGQQQALLHPALAYRVLAIVGDVDEAHACRDVEGQIFGVGFHANRLQEKRQALDGAFHPRVGIASHGR